MRSSEKKDGELFHVLHKFPPGDSPYYRAKHVQLIEKDPSKAIPLFWAAINTGDKVDSALKDMAVVMKQLNRCDEAIEAIKSFRHLCPDDSQESLDNVLLELYKKTQRLEEEVELLHCKLESTEEMITIGGNTTKIVRSQGKKIKITMIQELARILGNLAWAYMKQNDYERAEQYYLRALSLEPDKNKQCNLAMCLMHLDRIEEAKSLLQAVKGLSESNKLDDSCAKSFEHAYQMLTELQSRNGFLMNSSFPFTQRKRAITTFKSREERMRIGQEGALPFEEFRASQNAVLFTQPRCSWGFSNRNEKKGRWTQDAVGGSIRKLLFEDDRKGKIQACHELNGEFQALTNEVEATRRQYFAKAITSPTIEDWRNRSWKIIPQENGRLNANYRLPTIEKEFDALGSWWRAQPSTRGNSEAAV